MVAEGVETEARPMSAPALLLWAAADQPAHSALRASLFSDAQASAMAATPAPAESAFERIRLA